MVVIALLAKQTLQPALEATMRGRSEDRRDLSDRRTVQRQRRLTPAEVVCLAQEYAAGATVKRLADRYGVHRTTVLVHLERQGVSRRRCVRRMSGDDVDEAARLYQLGYSLKRTAERFSVDAETLRREFMKAGVSVRPRRGWSQ